MTPALQTITPQQLKFSNKPIAKNNINSVTSKNSQKVALSKHGNGLEFENDDKNDINSVQTQPQPQHGFFTPKRQSVSSFATPSSFQKSTLNHLKFDTSHTSLSPSLDCNIPLLFPAGGYHVSLTSEKFVKRHSNVSKNNIF